MSETSALADRLRAKYPAVGEKVVIDYATCQDGCCWFWKCDARGIYGGPFATEAEARRDSEVAVLGPDCKITETGQWWDPAWDQPQ
jgi:hypothetical protein